MSLCTPVEVAFLETGPLFLGPKMGLLRKCDFYGGTKTQLFFGDKQYPNDAEKPYLTFVAICLRFSCSMVYFYRTTYACHITFLWFGDQDIAQDPSTKHNAHIAHHLLSYHIITRRCIPSLNFHKKTNLYAGCRFQFQVLSYNGNTGPYVSLPPLRHSRTIHYSFSQNKVKRETTLNARNSLNIAPMRV